MGLRISRRVGGKVGINFSREGLSASIRTGIGAFGTAGFTLHTGIKGVTYRGTWFSSNPLGGRRWSVRWLLGHVLSLVLFAIKVAIIVLVLVGLLLFSILKLLWRLIARLWRKPDAGAPENRIIEATAIEKPEPGPSDHQP